MKKKYMKKKEVQNGIGLLPNCLVKKKKICIATLQLYCKREGCRNLEWATAQLYCKKKGVLYCNTISVLQVGKA